MIQTKATGSSFGWLHVAHSIRTTQCHQLCNGLLLSLCLNKSSNSLLVLYMRSSALALVVRIRNVRAGAALPFGLTAGTLFCHPSAHQDELSLCLAMGTWLAVGYGEATGSRPALSPLMPFPRNSAPRKNKHIGGDRLSFCRIQPEVFFQHIPESVSKVSSVLHIQQNLILQSASIGN